MATEKELELKKSIVDMAVEAWRFRDTFSRAMDKLDAGEGQRYLSKYNWFMKKVELGLKTAGLRTVNLEGQLYDPGFALSPVNIEDFDDKDILYVKSMLEPIIMEDDKLIKPGTAILGRVNT